MKIIHILKGKANPETMNGVNKVVHHLATEQLNLGIDVEVWGITKTHEIIRHQHEYPLVLFPATRLRFFLSNKLENSLDLINPKITLIHLHSVFLPELYSVTNRLKKKNISWVLSPHSGYNLNSMNKNKIMKTIYMRLFEKKIISGAQKIHAIGFSEISEIKNFNPSADVILLPNGQSFTDLAFNPVRKIKINESPVFGFCGRLTKGHKGLDLLIQGFGDYKKNGGRGELWLIGDGPDKSSLKELTKKEGISKSTRFLGPMFGDEKLSALNQINIFTHTSRWEGMPMAVLESAALGKPLLISRATNLGDYVLKYKNGIVLNENTIEVIAKTMGSFEQIYLNGGLQDMGNKSIELIQDELNWPYIAKKMASNLYQKNEIK